MSTPTAAQTIIPALDAAGYVTAVSGNLYSVRCPRSGIRMTVRRMAPGSTVAEICVASETTRSQEIDCLRDLAEALQAAGYAARRDLYEVRVNWAVCSAKSAQEAA